MGYGYLFGTIQGHLLTGDLRHGLLGTPSYFYEVLPSRRHCTFFGTYCPHCRDLWGLIHWDYLASEITFVIRELAVSHMWDIETNHSKRTQGYFCNSGSLRLWVRELTAFPYSQECEEVSHSWKWVAPYHEGSGSPHLPLDLSVSDRCVIGSSSLWNSGEFHMRDISLKISENRVYESKLEFWMHSAKTWVCRRKERSGARILERNQRGGEIRKLHPMSETWKSFAVLSSVSFSFSLQTNSCCNAVFRRLYEIFLYPA